LTIYIFFNEYAFTDSVAHFGVERFYLNDIGNNYIQLII